MSLLGDSDMTKGKIISSHLDRPGPYMMNNSSQRSSQAVALVTDISEALYQCIVSDSSVFILEICCILAPGKLKRNITVTDSSPNRLNQTVCGME